jgi:hypothetical protein
MSTTYYFLSALHFLVQVAYLSFLNNGVLNLKKCLNLGHFMLEFTPSAERSNFNALEIYLVIIFSSLHTRINLGQGYKTCLQIKKTGDVYHINIIESNHELLENRIHISVDYM